jgi:hypothetical protein
LRQTGTVEAFISEFQRVAVAVTNISEPRLVMLFIEGLVITQFVARSKGYKVEGQTGITGT